MKHAFIGTAAVIQVLPVVTTAVLRGPASAHPWASSSVPDLRSVEVRRQWGDAAWEMTWALFQKVERSLWRQRRALTSWLFSLHQSDIWSSGVCVQSLQEFILDVKEKNKTKHNHLGPPFGESHLKGDRTSSHCFLSWCHPPAGSAQAWWRCSDLQQRAWDLCLIAEQPWPLPRKVLRSF